MENNLKAKHRNLIKKIDDVTLQVADELLEEIKSASNNYGEVKRKVKFLEQNFMYSNKDKYVYLFAVLESLIQKEMNDLPLTNRS